MSQITIICIKHIDFLVDYLIYEQKLIFNEINLEKMC